MRYYYSFVLIVIIIIAIRMKPAAAIELNASGLCAIEGDSSECAEACSLWMQGNGICIYESCYCTDVGIGSCQDENHEGCDAICQEMSSNLIGFCMDGQCSCLS